MISSRCNDPIVYAGDTKTLTDLRRVLKEELESQLLLDSNLFDVWINEDAPPAEGSADSWEKCLQEVMSADIVLVLYNGNAGWAKEKGDVGICHAELQAALSAAPAKVYVIELPLGRLGKGPARSRNERFRQYVSTQTRFRGAVCETGDDVITRCKEALRDAVVDMVRLGGRETRKGQYARGTSLDWSRLNFQQRRASLCSIVRDCLNSRAGAEEEKNSVFIRIAGRQILALCDGIPGPMTVASAREMVGQPFLRDYESADLLKGERGGPIHLIACHRSVTEAQAAKQLGFPDATIVSPAFGVYVADNIQKIQMVFIANCRDETSTRHGVQRFFEWLEQSGEAKLLSDRAASRARIVQAIAAERALTA